jgi:photosystem II stability/assembly factor-like uncharacterized protein
MKQFITILALVIFSSVSVYSQNWDKLSPYPGTDQISDIYFYNSNLGFGVTSNGFILRTSDGGTTWTEIYCGHSDVIHGIYFTDENTGYACGYRKWILKSTDGGLTWSDLAYDESSTIGYQSVVFSDANTGFVVGGSGIVLKTTNAGTSWNTLSPGLSFDYEKILYLGSNTLLVFGFNQNILRSTNGGTNWTPIDGGVSFGKMGAHSPDNNTIYASCLGGYMSKSTNGGLSWTGSATGVTTNHLFAVFFTSTTTGYIADQYGHIWKTTDGGSVWSAQTSGVTNGFYGIFFTDSDKGFVGGYQCALLSTTDGGSHWASLNKGVGFNIYAGWFTDINTGYIGNGDREGLYKTTNGGIDWININSSVAQGGLYDLMFIGTENGFGCGANSDWSAAVFIKTTDAGSTWIETDITPTGIASPYSLSFPNASIGYIIGYNSTFNGSVLAKTTDGGNNWTVVKSDFVPIYSCHFIDADTGYVAGESGYAAKTTNGGTSWTVMTMSTTETLQSIIFYNSNLGFACGSNGKILKTIDGGSVWDDKSVTTTKTLYRIKFVNEDDVLACGSRGAIYLSNNGGTNWSDQSINAPVDFYATGMSGSTGWVLGSSGSIYRSNSPLPVELASFTASTNGIQVILNWHTATEVNNYGFEVERRMDNSDQPNQETSGQVTVDSWTKIGFVKGAGTSNALKEYSYLDAANTAGNYVYRLKQIDADGTFKYSQSVEVTVQAPEQYLLDQNYPNPFNPTTAIHYQVPVASPVTLKVYNVLGEEVAMLVNEKKEAGSYTATFNGSTLSSGVYFFKISADRFSSIRKMILMK